MDMTDCVNENRTKTRRVATTLPRFPTGAQDGCSAKKSHPTQRPRHGTSRPERLTQVPSNLSGTPTAENLLHDKRAFASRPTRMLRAMRRNSRVFTLGETMRNGSVCVQAAGFMRGNLPNRRADAASPYPIAGTRAPPVRSRVVTACDSSALPPAAAVCDREISCMTVMKLHPPGRRPTGPHPGIPRPGEGILPR